MEDVAASTRWKRVVCSSTRNFNANKTFLVKKVHCGADTGMVQACLFLFNRLFEWMSPSGLGKVPLEWGSGCRSMPRGCNCRPLQRVIENAPSSQNTACLPVA
jgi:hypothetical protein